MHQAPIILFVCQHGAAKSIIAAAYFNQLAGEKNLGLHAMARGTHPDTEISPKTIAGLREDGLTPTESVPQKLTMADCKSAQRVISFCDLPVEYQQTTAIEHWEAVPPVSEDYEQSRDAIIVHLQKLIDNL
jgi:arsenate reductase (thioredoxin)